jgi:leader peptidase (prepilin peptidase)/N-methyltransferase
MTGAVPQGFELAAVAAFGLVFGSFLNVLIHRLPRKESIVRPGSRCPGCGRALGWKENLPVVSWLWLKGRCAGCRAPIALRYPLVEVAAAGVLLLVWLRFGLTVPFFVFAPFALAMVALFVIDLEHQLLPDAITLPGIALGVALSPWNPHVTWLGSLLGAALGYGLLWGLAEAYERLRGVSGLGGGDIKLAAMIGAFAGPKSVIEVLLLASLVGVLFGLALVALRRAGMQDPIPFGCFLTPAALLVALLGGDALWQAWQLLVLRHLYGIEPGPGAPPGPSP